jgi:hypothetical protein
MGFRLPSSQPTSSGQRIYQGKIKKIIKQKRKIARWVLHEFAQAPDSFASELRDRQN